MKLDLRSRGVVVTAPLMDELNKRLQLALGRVDRRIEAVRVYLSDVNGPRGGIDMQCRVVVELPRRGRVIVSTAEPDLRAAISVALNRAAYAVRRHLRQRDPLRRRRSARSVQMAG